jgi:hypothetical protein
VLAPIREYLLKVQPPGDHLIRPLLQHFRELLELYIKFQGTQSNTRIIDRISSNHANIQNVMLYGLHPGHPDLINSIYCSCYLIHFGGVTSRERIPIISQIPELLLQARDAQLEVYFITMLFSAWVYHPLSDPQTLISQALEQFHNFDDVDLKCLCINFFSLFDLRRNFRQTLQQDLILSYGEQI